MASLMNENKKAKDQGNTGGLPSGLSDMMGTLLEQVDDLKEKTKPKPKEE